MPQMNLQAAVVKDPAVQDDILVSANIPLSADEERVLKLYPGATPQDWEDWRWQMRNRIRTLEALEKVMTLTPTLVRKVNSFFASR